MVQSQQAHYKSNSNKESFKVSSYCVRLTYFVCGIKCNIIVAACFGYTRRWKRIVLGRSDLSVRKNTKCLKKKECSSGLKYKKFKFNRVLQKPNIAFPFWKPITKIIFGSMSLKSYNCWWVVKWWARFCASVVEFVLRN